MERRLRRERQPGTWVPESQFPSGSQASASYMGNACCSATGRPLAVAMDYLLGLVQACKTPPRIMTQTNPTTQHRLRQGLESFGSNRRC